MLSPLVFTVVQKVAWCFFGSRVLSLASLNCLLECKVYRSKDIVTKKSKPKVIKSTLTSFHSSSEAEIEKLFPCSCVINFRTKLCF